MENRAIPLTEEIIQDMRKSYEWLLKRNLTETQRNELRQQLIQACKADPQQARSYKVSLQSFKNILIADSLTQEAYRKKNTPIFIEGLRQIMHQNQLAYELVHDYDQANRRIQAPASSSTNASPLVKGGLAVLGVLGGIVVSSLLKKVLEPAENPVLKDAIKALEPKPLDEALDPQLASLLRMKEDQDNLEFIRELNRIKRTDPSTKPW